MNKKELKALMNRAVEVQEMLEANKKLYRELDEIVEKFVEAQVFAVESDDNRLTLIDNFLEKNTQFRVARFPRYSLQIDKILRIREKKEAVKKVQVKKKERPAKQKLAPKKAFDDSFFKVRRRSDR